MRKLALWVLALIPIFFISCENEETFPSVDSNFTINNQIVLVGDSVVFTDESTGEPTKWAWILEGTNLLTSSVQNPIVVYSEAGVYTVALSSSNPKNTDSEVKVDFITVIENIQADFTGSDSAVFAGNTVTFSDNSVGNPDAWEWTFDGGNPSSSTDKNPIVTYDEIGTYTVSLTISNDLETHSITKEDFIIVVEEVECQYSVSDSVINEGGMVSFTDLSLGQPNSWEWVFTGGSPNTSDQQNPQIGYMSAGVFDVSLKSSNILSSNTLVLNNKIVVLPKNNLVAFYPFSGNSNDQSISNLDGNLIGNTVLTTDISNKTNRAYLFDGSGDYIDCGTDNRNITDEITVSAWFKTSSFKPQHIVGKGAYSEDAGFALSMSDGKVRFSGNDGNGVFITTDFSHVINDNLWHHAVGVVKGSLWQIWLDCQLIDEFNTGHSSVSLSGSLPLTIGYFYFGTADGDHRDFDGSIDNVRIYNKGLSLEAVNALCKDDHYFELN